MKAIIVLGAAVWADGPSPTLRRRCAEAARVWHTGGYDLIVVCGGLGHHPPTEAEAMSMLLKDADVPAAAIRREDQSTTTFENLAFARDILRPLGVAEVMIVTDRYHGPRARMVARALGLQAQVSSPPTKDAHKRTQIKQIIREAAALPGYAGKLLIKKVKGQL